MRRTAVALLIVALSGAIGGAIWAFRSAATKVPAFRTASVKRGDLVATISATGTIEPEAAVDIGAQVAGVIVAFGIDKDGRSVTWGSTVDVGTVLAKIDDSLYVAAVKTAEAQINQYSGQLARDQAILDKDRLDLARYQKLAAQNAIAQQQAEDQFYVVHQDEGTVKLDQGLVDGARASLLAAQTNLDYCTIKSPVKGVVIDRRVNIGQTVVSSLNAPSLFLIANDLSHIQVWVSVNEADVGGISRGNPVTFTVDAIPGRSFHGQVGQVRLNAAMTQNVVTYTVEVDTDNSDGALLPYLTANAKFEIGRSKGVLLVPNAALHWWPRAGQVVPGAEQLVHVHRPDETEQSATIWVTQGGFVRPISVKTGLTDGGFTEVEGRGLTEGQDAVVSEYVRDDGATQESARSPFTPQIFRGPRRDQSEPNQTTPRSTSSAQSAATVGR